MNFVLGIDGGGTSCRAALATGDGEVIGRAKSGAANIRTDLTGARTHIVESARQAFIAAGQNPDLIPQTPAILGLAGANVGTYRQQLEAILPFSQSRVETDAEIALEGAVGSGDGAMAILGTGTAYMARKNGKSRAIGGWGFQVGDQGSGALEPLGELHASCGRTGHEDERVATVCQSSGQHGADARSGTGDQVGGHRPCRLNG